MRRFKNILVVLDTRSDNRSLFEQAYDLALRNQAEITVVDIVQEAPPVQAQPSFLGSARIAQEQKVSFIEEVPFSDTPSAIPDSSPQSRGENPFRKKQTKLDIRELIVQEEKRNLEQFVFKLEQAGIQVKSKILNGVPFILIIQEVLRNQHDLVMTTADGSGTGKGSLFGSTSMHLMRKCPCPVWVIKPGQPRKFERILVALDLVKEDVERTALATKLMNMATALARTSQSELLVIHTWTLYGESVLRGRGGVSSDTLEILLHETRDAHRQALQEFLQQHPLDDLRSEIFLLKGEAGDVIPGLAQVKQVDLIVMGTVSRSGLPGFLIGNSAEKVLPLVDCSLLTVKPEGFISPVKADQG